jgi:hypothetical protein
MKAAAHTADASDGMDDPAPPHVLSKSLTPDIDRVSDHAPHLKDAADLCIAAS